MNADAPSSLAQQPAPGLSPQDRAFARRIARGFKTGGGRHRSDSRRARIDATWDAEWWLDGADIHQIVANAAADCAPPIVRTGTRHRRTFADRIAEQWLDASDLIEWRTRDASGWWCDWVPARNKRRPHGAKHPSP